MLHYYYYEVAKIQKYRFQGQNVTQKMATTLQRLHWVHLHTS
jgi:hypothetical protein